MYGTLKKLGDIIDILDNKRIPISSSEREKRIFGKPEKDLIPYYGATQQNGRIDDYIFEEELILLGEDGVLFYDTDKPKAYLINGKSRVNNHAHVIKAKKDIAINSYLCYFLNKFDYHGFVTGATRLKLNQSAMKNIPINLPPLATQRTIAAKLDQLQSLINLKKQAIAKTDNLAKSIFLEMFSDPMTNEKEWKICNLENITTITMGQSPDGESYNEDEIGIPFFQGKAEFTDKYPIVKKWTTKPTKQAKINDILMSVRAPVGDINLCNIDCCIGRGLASIRVKDVNLNYLYAILGYLKKSISDLGTGSTFKAISSQQLKNLNIICPPLSLQQKFADIITKLESTKEKNKQALAKLEDLYQSEMQRSFSL